MTDQAAGLAQAEAFARIRLLRSPNVGPITFAQLVRRFGSAEAALDALPDLAAPRGKAYRIAPLQQIEAEIAAVRKAGARYLFHDSPDYPALLREIESAPPILIVRGDTALLHRPCVAMVGARNASAAAIKLARDFAQGLAAQGFVVVSGLARGIDGAAHQGALAGGGTIGVIASGIDVVYPPEASRLAGGCCDQGLAGGGTAAGDRAAGAPFPLAQPHYCGLGCRNPCGRSRAAFRLADHRASGW